MMVSGVGRGWQNSEETEPSASSIEIHAPILEMPKNWTPAFPEISYTSNSIQLKLIMSTIDTIDTFRDQRSNIHNLVN